MANVPDPQTSQEQAFLAYVREHDNTIGFGRMMEIISHAWYREDQYGALTVGKPLAHLVAGQRQREEHDALHDRLFGDESQALLTRLEAQLLQAALRQDSDACNQLWWRMTNITGRNGLPAFNTNYLFERFATIRRDAGFPIS